MGQIYKQLEFERFIELKRAEEENKRLREALIDIATTWQDSDEPQLTQLEMHARAKEALGGEVNG